MKGRKISSVCEREIPVHDTRSWQAGTSIGISVLIHTPCKHVITEINIIELSPNSAIPISRILHLLLRKHPFPSTNVFSQKNKSLRDNLITPLMRLPIRKQEINHQPPNRKQKHQQRPQNLTPNRPRRLYNLDYR